MIHEITMDVCRTGSVLLYNSGLIFGNPPHFFREVKITVLSCWGTCR